VIRASGEIQRIGVTTFPVVVIADFKGPQAVDDNGLPLESRRRLAIVHRTDERAGRRVEAIDTTISEIPDQQGIGELPEALRRHGHPPRRIEFALNESAWIAA